MSRLLPARLGRAPVRVFARRIDRATERQLLSLADQPYVVGHVASMADAHLAEGVAVGTVFATEGVVVPGALGGDLGCGMSAVPFPRSLRTPERSTLERLLVGLSQAIPVGENEHRPPRPAPQALLEAPLSTSALTRTKARLLGRQLGTLGGGNHFLELDRDTTGRLWLLVHTGSRGIGGAIGAHHLKVAGGPLRPLQLDKDAGASFLADLEVSLQVAEANRSICLAAAAEVFGSEFNEQPEWSARVDLFHNFVREEVHEGRPLHVHRKGAIPAPAGALGLIPGSMGTATYLVRGRGALSSWCSASHGAGRVFSRGEARRRIKPAALAATMRRIVYDVGQLGPLVEEAPDAYRDVRVVLEDQAELIEPILRMEPLLVLKG